MTSEANLTVAQNASRPGCAGTPDNLGTIHVLTLTPFFPSAENPVYGTYIGEPIEHFGEFNLRSTVMAVSPLHHRRHSASRQGEAEWLRYPVIPSNAGLTTAGWFLSRRVLARVQKIHERSPIHVIHAHAALPCGHAAWLLGVRLRIPFVVTVHGLDVFNACFEPGTAAAKRRSKLSMDVYREAASVVCISRAVQDILRQGMEEQASGCVIYNGTDAELFSPPGSETPPLKPKSGLSGPPNILMVGNLLRGKGQEIVFRAMTQVAEQFPDLTCTVIGEGQDEQRFRDFVREHGIAERVSFIGRQDRRAVAEAMCECTIFALPSRFEGLGCAYLEAMACGKPVIACEGQGIAEIIRHRENGWLIPVDGTAEMAGALRELLSSAELRISIGTSARQTIVSGLTLKDQVRQLNGLYRQVTGK